MAAEAYLNKDYDEANKASAPVAPLATLTGNGGVSPVDRAWRDKEFWEKRGKVQQVTVTAMGPASTPSVASGVTGSTAVGGQPSYNYGAYGTYSGAARCTHSGQHVVTIGGVKILGATKLYISELHYVRAKTLVLNLSGSPLNLDNPMDKVGPIWKARLEKHTTLPQVIQLEWGDMQVPLLNRGFWKALWHGIQEDKFKQVLTCCVGGHGRTGTAIACLMVTAIPGMTAKGAIHAVRKYCTQAVETLDQEEYIYWVAKEKFKWEDLAISKLADVIAEDELEIVHETGA